MSNKPLIVTLCVCIDVNSSDNSQKITIDNGYHLSIPLYTHISMYSKH